jgi:hypothetical protein
MVSLYHCQYENEVTSQVKLTPSCVLDIQAGQEEERILSRKDDIMLRMQRWHAAPLW